MEVILKKSKITKSIIDQMQKSTMDDMENSEVLGWCSAKEINFIILQNPETLKITRFPKVVKEIKTNISDGWFMITMLYNIRYMELVVCKTKDDAEYNRFLGLLQKIQKDADDKGQFYI